MFLPMVSGKKVPGLGRAESKIALVGDAVSGWDINSMSQFNGPAGSVLDQCLHAAGLIRGECYLTSLIKEKYSNLGIYFREKDSTFTQKGLDTVNELVEELNGTKANIIVALGNMTATALCGIKHLTRFRGYLYSPIIDLHARKVIPTFHPTQSIRGMYIYRYIMASDLKKAKEQSSFPDLIRPERLLLTDFQTVEQAISAMETYVDVEKVGFDIEVMNYEVSYISFSTSADSAISIPITGRWTTEEEVLIWKEIQKILGNPKSVKVVQNGMFDIPFLATRNGIIVRGPIHDTMVAHSIMYPEMQMGLGFLGSLYCGSQEYWKDMVKFKNIKDES